MHTSENYFFMKTSSFNSILTSHTTEVTARQQLGCEGVKTDTKILPNISHLKIVKYEP